MRVPRPAAGTIAAIRLIGAVSYRNPRVGGKTKGFARFLRAARLGIERARRTFPAPGSALARTAPRRFRRRGDTLRRFVAVIVAAKNHFSGRGLVDGSHVDINGLVNHFARA